MKKTALVFVIVMLFTIILSPSAKALDRFLVVNEPRDNFMTNSGTVVVSGETVPNANVVVMVNGKTKARVNVGAAGIFLTQVPITSRNNIITVRANIPYKSPITVSRRVYQLQNGSGQLDSLANH